MMFRHEPMPPPASVVVAPASPDPATPHLARREVLAVTGWLLLLAIVCGRFAWTTSPTFDEPGLIYAGYANLTANATKSSTGNLVFAQTWSALPLLAHRPTLPTQAEVQSVEPANREFGRLFLFHPANDWRAILRVSRAMTIALAILLGVVVFAASRRFFGPAAAQLSLGFYCLSPVILSNSALATTDLAAALWFTVVVMLGWSAMQRLTWRTLILCGVATGLLFATKFSSFAIAPMLALMAGIRIAAGPPLMVALFTEETVTNRWKQLRWLAGGAGFVAMLTALTLWLVYLPSSTWFADAGATPVPWEKLPRPNVLASSAVFLQGMHLLPEPYLVDLWVFANSMGGRRAFLLEHYSVNGWWYFFPVAWWFKTPVSFLIAVVVACLGLLRQRARWYALVPMVVLVVVYGVITLRSPLNIGIRHLLSLYPALFVLAGPGCLLPRTARLRTTMCVALLSGSALELWPVRTELLSYFNVFAGGPREGHRILVDSSYEWGQDLPALETWLKQREARPGTKSPVYFSYFGNADLRRFQIAATLLPQFFDLRPTQPYELKPGTYVISATMLHSVYGPLLGPWRASYESAYRALLPAAQGSVLTPDDSARSRLGLYDALRFGRLCAYLRKRPPDARVTNGLLVFELSQPELDAALRQPLPENQSTYEVPGTESLPQAGMEFLK